MKKIISMAFIAGLIVNGISAMESKPSESAVPKTEVPNTSVASPVSPGKAELSDSTVSESSVGSKSEVKDASATKEPGNNDAATGVNKLVAPIKKFVLDHKIASSIVGLALAGYIGHKVMVSVCPWYKQLVGDEDEEETKTPRLNPRVMNPARPF